MHMKVHTNQEKRSRNTKSDTNANSIKKRFECLHCEMSFFLERHLIKHVAKLHCKTEEEDKDETGFCSGSELDEASSGGYSSGNEDTGPDGDVSNPDQDDEDQQDVLKNDRDAHDKDG